MATHSKNSPGLPLLEANHSHSGDYLLGGELPQIDFPQQIRSYGDSSRELVLRQAPMHARVAMGKEKGTKRVISFARPILLTAQTENQSILLQ